MRSRTPTRRTKNRPPERRVLGWLSNFPKTSTTRAIGPTRLALPLHTTILREPAADLINRIASPSHRGEANQRPQ